MTEYIFKTLQHWHGGLNSLWPWHLVAILAAVGMTYLSIHPILSFCRRGWQIKRADVLSSLNDEAKRRYLQFFLKQSSDNPAHAFDTMYTYRYGRYRLITPTVILAVVLFFITVLVAETALARIYVVNSGSFATLGTVRQKWPFLFLPGEALAAIVGAYTWIVYALISGAARYDLPPATILSSVLRLVVAAPLGYAIGSIVSTGLAPFVAFAIGAFPLQTVQLILQRLATKNLNIELNTTNTPDQVTQLDGVDSLTADRLQVVGITTIGQLAYCDPVQLSMGTNLTFDFVVDIVSQALAWLYLGPQLNDLRKIGLRGAMEIRTLTEDMVSPTQGTREPAANALTAAVGITKTDAAGLKRAFEEIALDPYTGFLADVWLPSAAAATVQETRSALQRVINQDVHARISTRAYRLWEQAGKPDGRAEEFWDVAARRESVAILGYGSLMIDAGDEISRARTHIDEVKTPFLVEYAHSSTETRGGAPTLTVHTRGGSVNGKLLVLQPEITRVQAEDMLYRRERNRVGSSERYRANIASGENPVMIEAIYNAFDVAVVLYARLNVNIDPLSAEHLAELALRSARSSRGGTGRDGISYLMDMKTLGIETPLSVNYEKEILRQAAATSLSDALRKLRPAGT
jgi:cation transport regulator ChaC